MLVKKTEHHGLIKWASLLLLTLQGCVLPLLVRYTRIRTTQDKLFVSSSLVLLNEVCKLIACLAVIFFQSRDTLQDGCYTRFKCCVNDVYEAVVLQPIETLKVCVPSIIYTVQNNLYYVALSNLDPSTYCITYQLKIITTAVFFVIILRKPLSGIQWISLVVLAAGVAIVQLQNEVHTSAHSNGPHQTHHQNQLLGLIAVLIMSLSSGFAGVYFEKVLKGSTQSVWMQNVRLALLGIPMSAIIMLAQDWQVIKDKGVFYGYDSVVLVVVGLSSFGGLLIAFVMKFADNILKAYAQSLAIILACLGSGIWFEFVPTIPFFGGSLLVCVSIYLYSRYPYKSDVLTPGPKESVLIRSPSTPSGYFMKMARMSFSNELPGIGEEDIDGDMRIAEKKGMESI